MGEELGPKPDRPNIQVRWVSLAEAARMLNITPVAVRKQIANRTLTGMRAGRGWRVLLPGASVEAAQGVNGQPAVDRGMQEALAKTTESLSSLVRDLQQQNLTLAAQIGFLQNQLAQSKEQVKHLEERREAALLATIANEEHEAALKELTELRKSVTLYQQELARRREEPAKRRSWLKRMLGRGGS